MLTKSSLPSELLRTHFSFSCYVVIIMLWLTQSIANTHSVRGCTSNPLQLKTRSEVLLVSFLPSFLPSSPPSFLLSFLPSSLPSFLFTSSPLLSSPLFSLCLLFLLFIVSACSFVFLALLSLPFSYLALLCPLLFCLSFLPCSPFFALLFPSFALPFPSLCCPLLFPFPCTGKDKEKLKYPCQAHPEDKARLRTGLAQGPLLEKSGW